MSWSLPFFRRPAAGDAASAPAPADDLVVLVDATLDPRLVVYHDPRSFPSEQYRGFRTNLRALNPEDAPRTLMFTSGAPDEGKSTTLANIALSLAEFDPLRVCLIDMDLRAPRQHELFGLPRSPGITDVLLDRVDPRRALLPGGVPNLNVIPAGRPTNSPHEVVASDYMQDFIGHLKREFQYVLFDTPPATLFSDACELSQVMDGVIVVVSLDESHKGESTEAMELLDAAGANVVGSFVTGTTVEGPTIVAEIED